MVSIMLKARRIANNHFVVEVEFSYRFSRSDIDSL